MANGGVPNGCGFPFLAKCYFIAFQLIVSQIFLNLFIAIVIDAFSHKSEEMALPVHSMDIFYFGEVWSKFDPNATGFIPLVKLEEFILELSQTEATFFMDAKEEVQYILMRENFIIKLDVPTHNNFSTIMYYDLLLSLCRFVCEEDF